MKYKIRFLIFLAMAVADLRLFAAATAAAGSASVLESPNGQIRIRISTAEGNRLTYQVAWRSGTAVLEPSPLGMVLDGRDLGVGAELGKPKFYRRRQSYSQYGVHSTAVDYCRGMQIPLRHIATGLSYTLDVRAFNDGIAFRLVVPGEESQDRTPEEATRFRLPAGSLVWYHDFEGHYEALHVRKAIGEVQAGEWAAPPLTFRLPGNAGFASITEGALIDYPGMGLQADGQGGFCARLGHAVPPSYPFRLRYKADIERVAQPARIRGTITTPWRIVLVSRDLNGLVNSDIVSSVASPPDPRLFPKGNKTEWIRPGRAVWKYLDGGENTLAEMRNFSRLAGELGFEYNLIEGFWQKWSPSELKEFVDFSRRQGVGIWLWKHSKDLRDAESRRQFFQVCRDAGAVGAKIDFFDHEAKEVVELYAACLSDAARFQIMVNFHGANKPTGESRTWPNELTREGVRGMESRKTNRASHDATLPFTRLLAGPADYTPMHFGDRRNDTTWAHQVASAAILTSPLLVYAAHPANILQNPCAGMVRSIPSVWDETIALPVSEIGEVAVLARRTGNTWFLAVVNGAAARTLSIPLSFLGRGTYEGLTIGDTPDNPADVTVGDVRSTRRDTVAVRLSSGGGFLARYRPSK